MPKTHALKLQSFRWEHVVVGADTLDPCEQVFTHSVCNPLFAWVPRRKQGVHVSFANPRALSLSGDSVRPEMRPRSGCKASLGFVGASSECAWHGRAACCLLQPLLVEHIFCCVADASLNLLAHSPCYSGLDVPRRRTSQPSSPHRSATTSSIPKAANLPRTSYIAFRSWTTGPAGSS